MKKEYDAPKAEKVEFDYTETVVASHGWCNQGKESENEGDIKYNNDPNGQYYKCLATYYYNC